METNPQNHTEPRPNNDRQHDTNHSDGNPLAPKDQPERQGNAHPDEDVYVNGKVQKP